MKKLFAALLLCVFCLSIDAQTFNNYKKEYSLKSITEAQIEAKRTHRMVLCDYQPSGLYVRKGEKVIFDVSNLNQEYSLSSMIGFKPIGSHTKTQENQLNNGTNTVIAAQDGILSFIFVKKSGYDTKPSMVNIFVTGGKAFPFYYLNIRNLANWENDLKIMKDAPFIQLASDKALITISYQDYLKFPIRNIAEFFNTLHYVIDLEDELAGFDNSSPENTRTNNRTNYLVDIYSTPEERKRWYMYATSYFIGMKNDNFVELTSGLSKSWGLWHETGHTHQQRSWTWGSIGEISVNTYSLYVQEKFGGASRIGTIQPGETESSFSKAKKYLANPNKNYLVISRTDYDEYFTKLVMFHQLKTVYGWDVIKRLNQHFRKTPYVYTGETDQDKANKFVYAMCLITKNNLVPFFKKWGLNIDAATTVKINGLNLRIPAVDPASIFR